MLYLDRVGKEWAGPVFPHHLKSKGCLHIHNRVRLILLLVRVGKEWAGPVFPHPLEIKHGMGIRDRGRLILSLVRVGKEWTSHVFLHPDNHLHKVDALSCQGGERNGCPSFLHPVKSKGCLHIHDSERLILLLVGVGKQ